MELFLGHNNYLCQGGMRWRAERGLLRVRCPAIGQYYIDRYSADRADGREDRNGVPKTPYGIRRRKDWARQPRASPFVPRAMGCRRGSPQERSRCAVRWLGGRARAIGRIRILVSSASAAVPRRVPRRVASVAGLRYAPARRTGMATWSPHRGHRARHDTRRVTSEDRKDRDVHVLDRVV